MNGECGMLNAECGRGTASRAVAVRALPPSAFSIHPSAFPVPPSSLQPPASSLRRRRRAVTLVELLITMAIMAIISAAILGTASAAMEAARRDRTQTLVNKIAGLINEQVATYETRRVEPHGDFNVSINHSFSRMMQGQARQDVRLLALRELMKYEMPDRWSDVINARVIDKPPSTPLMNFEGPKFLGARPALSQNYLRRYRSLKPSATAKDITLNQGAECLYMVVMQATGEGEARTLFSKQDIADTDGDGANEFVDGWRQPISWIRWPASFNKSGLMGVVSAESDHDPADIYRRDRPGSTGPNPSAYTFPPSYVPVVNVPQAMTDNLPGLRDAQAAFRVVPIIYSRGPDEASDLNTGSDDFIASLNPYDPGPKIGAIMDTNSDAEDNSIDNIHNHLNEY